MHTTEPQPTQDRDLLAALAGELLTNPETSLKVACSTIIDERFKPTGKQAWRIVLEGITDHVPARFLAEDPTILRHAQTADGSLTMSQEYGKDENGRETIRSKITIYPRSGENPNDLGGRGGALLAAFPLPEGFSRECYRHTPVYAPDVDETPSLRITYVNIDITDRQRPLSANTIFEWHAAPPGVDVIEHWIAKGREMIPGTTPLPVSPKINS